MNKKKKSTKKQKVLQEEVKKELKRGKKTNREMAIVTYIALALFLIMIAYMIKFLITDSGSVLNNQYNKRQSLLAETIVKGSILSDNGKELAKTVTDSQGNESRMYPYDDLFANTVGRVNKGKTGLEADESYTMLTTNINPILGMMNQIKGEKNPGNNVVTTLNLKLSKVAYSALGSRKGAVVVMDPETGKILTMVSTPSYNPNTVDDNWDSLIADTSNESRLYNRATQGLYPPGSTFKLVTALEYMRENPDYDTFSYNCTGSIGKGKSKISCYGGSVHGRLTLSSAFAHSCNSAFAKIGTNLDITNWKSLCTSLYFNKSIPFDIEQKNASFTLDSNADRDTIRQTAIGQGDTLVTPLQNILLVAAAENGGTIMKPYLVDRIEDAYGNTVRETSPATLSTPITKKEAKRLRSLMEATVSSGTATAMAYSSYHAGGKTGSAEFELGSSESHAWYVGFAEKNNKKLVISVIVERGGTGSQAAVPIAKSVFDAYFN